MADDSITIDPNSVFDNPTDRQVEFRGAIDGEARDFAVRYSVIEALTGAVPAEPADDFARVADAVATAALVALARSDEGDTVIVSERDLDQTGSAAPGPHAGPEADAMPTEEAGTEAEAHPS